MEVFEGLLKILGYDDVSRGNSIGNISKMIGFNSRYDLVFYLR